MNQSTYNTVPAEHLKYLCGSCGNVVQLKHQEGDSIGGHDGVECNLCSGKILYKLRTTEPLATKAR
ncbi:hypothetical protein J8273_7948 [Carpediemonas membranifera]|uniref:Uncharacterized protein n=1 Tax=Carpediemonas membranifera TaxID=201153 RepID=A0A8J6B5S2_9EUKA|nr:hypothetical protein J8273_7948 [Carpediemonas membranifera]|eukprot:KAG9390597.1 hypothetical protein J8273_7948 [Carpediemonas membranifera]